MRSFWKELNGDRQLHSSTKGLKTTHRVVFSPPSLQKVHLVIQLNSPKGKENSRN